METIGAYEVKTHLSGVLKRVEQGESFTITRNGTPVAKLVPLEEKPEVDVREVIKEIRRFRKQRPLGGLSVAELKELINEGRRL
jgi:prevent-host-death family protein